jgi:bifunctional DNA-binding transcriptional regulator/antitoxin component of YhaV-PrlF toxin-antitoxin module
MNPLCFILLSIYLLQSYVFIGVVDRTEGDQVVILVEDAGEEIILEKNEQFKEGKWFLIYWRDNKPLILKSLPVINSERKIKAKQLLEELRNRDSTYYPSINAPIAPAYAPFSKNTIS